MHHNMSAFMTNQLVCFIYAYRVPERLISTYSSVGQRLIPLLRPTTYRFTQKAQLLVALLNTSFQSHTYVSEEPLPNFTNILLTLPFHQVLLVDRNDVLTSSCSLAWTKKFDNES